MSTPADNAGAAMPAEKREVTQQAESAHPSDTQHELVIKVVFTHNDPDNPRCWSRRRRWILVIIVSLYSFGSLAASTLIAPALPEIAADLHIKSSIETQLTLSTFILSVAFGPLFFGPLCEIFGRVLVLHISNLFFLLFNSLCAISKTEGQLIAFRLLSGFGASATWAISPGIISDCFVKEERGQGIAVLGTVPLLAPALGPMAAAAMLGRLSWRWVFGVTSFFGAAVGILGYITLRETYAPVILARRAARLRKESGDDRYHAQDESQDRSIVDHIRKNINRAMLYLCTEPIVWLISFYTTASFGVLYLFLSTFPLVWTEVYRERVAVSGLHYIAYGLGLFVGTQLGTRLLDRIYRKLKQRNQGQSRAEYRLPLLLGFSVLSPASLILYGWTINPRIHWIVPTIGAFFFGIGYIVPTQCTIAYTLECYGKHSASASAATNVFRNIAGFAFPLFGPLLYKKLGRGWGNSLLALVLLMSAVPTTLVLWWFGARLRARSKHASADEDDELIVAPVHVEEAVVQKA